jgi:hypothetical protein
VKRKYKIKREHVVQKYFKGGWITLSKPLSFSEASDSKTVLERLYTLSEFRVIKE